MCLQCGRPGFNPWVGKIPWRRGWQTTPVFLPGESLLTEELGGLQSTGSQRIRYDWVTKNKWTDIKLSWERGVNIFFFFFPLCPQLETTGLSEVNSLWEALFSYNPTPLPFPCAWYCRSLWGPCYEPKTQFLSVSILVLTFFSLPPSLQSPPTMTSQRKRYHSSHLGLASTHGIDLSFPTQSSFSFFLPFLTI